MYFFLKYIVTLFYKKLRIKIIVCLLCESGPRTAIVLVLNLLIMLTAASIHYQEALTSTDSTRHILSSDIYNTVTLRTSQALPTVSVAATKVPSKFHTKISQKFWQKSLKLFDETFTQKFRLKSSPGTFEILTKFLRKYYMRFVSHRPIYITCTHLNIPQLK